MVAFPDFNKDLVADALGLLLEQYKGKPVLQAVVISLAEEIQELRDAAKEVQQSKDFKQCFGIYLNYFGKIVAAARNSDNDEAYRLLIGTKIAQNKSFGRAQDFETIFELLGNDPSTLRLTEVFPAGGTITATQPLGTVLIPGPDMLDVLRRLFFTGKTQAAGVRLRFIFVTSLDDFRYRNAGDVSQGNHGYGDRSNPSTLTYGKWSSVL